MLSVSHPVFIEWGAAGEASMPGGVMFLCAVARKTMVEKRKSEIHHSFSFKGDAHSVSNP